MKPNSSKISIVRTGFLDITSPIFFKAFPHLVPGELRRTLSVAEIEARASSEILAIAKIVLKSMDSYDRELIERMAEKFCDRIFGSDLIDKFDPKIGSMGAFLYGVMRKIPYECFRERSRWRIANAEDQSGICSKAPGPYVIAERCDLIQQVREWAMKLPRNQRNAVARKYEAIADLDTGGIIPNEVVNRHRSLKCLRQRADEADANNNSRRQAERIDAN